MASSASNILLSIDTLLNFVQAHSFGTRARSEHSVADDEKFPSASRFSMINQLPPKKPSIYAPMAKTYDSAAVESGWDEWWEKCGFYKPESSDSDETFVMMIPPPNVTGVLHLGHALMATIEDAITRYWRMKGKRCLWLPGTDHAGISTQSVVERRLARDNISRHDLGRERFLDEVWRWKEEHGNTICAQLRRMGCSVDWSRCVFTMDEKLSRAVTEAFVRMYEAGLIYRDNRLCHWSCALQSAISNAEVELTQLDKPTRLRVPGYEKTVEFGVIHKFGYRVVGEEDTQLIVATTRMETMLGDTAVAVHPEDPRYSHLHGRFVQHPFLDRQLPIICDAELVDMSVGTGAVKITPAHDENDFNCGKRHDLEFINILTDDGLINEFGGEFVGQRRYDARLNIIKELEKRGQFHGKDPNPMTIQTCQRSHDIIEPRLAPQWYVNCEDMARRSLEASRSGRLKIRPDVIRWEEFLTRIRPWCISRQLWWGHRIPAYLVSVKSGSSTTAELDEHDANSWVVARTEEEALAIAQERFGGRYGKDNIEVTQDPDVLDTWFSSGLFPFSTLGWPDNTSDLREYFPGHLLETGGDIIFFWVARMVMMSLQLMDELPFTEVYLHPMVRDKHGKKMSKSKGNVINPLHVIDSVDLETLVGELHAGNIPEKEIKKYEKAKREEFPKGIPRCGADALRFGLLAYLQQGRSINLDVQRVEGYRHFCNKLWNAVRFALTHFPQDYTPPGMERSELCRLPLAAQTLPDRWILSRLNECVRVIDGANPTYDFATSTAAIYKFFLHELCDVYLETTKPIFADGTYEQQCGARDILYVCLDYSFKLMHPFIPFVTEELWQRLPGRMLNEALIVETYPEPFDTWTNEESESQMELVTSVVKTIRQSRQGLGLSSNTRMRVHATSRANQDLLYKFAAEIGALAYCESFDVTDPSDPRLSSCTTSVVSADISIYSEIEDFVRSDTVDLRKRLDQLYKDKANVENYVDKMTKKVTNSRFVENNSAETLEEENRKLDDKTQELNKLNDTIDQFQRLLRTFQIDYTPPDLTKPAKKNKKKKKKSKS